MDMKLLQVDEEMIARAKADSTWPTCLRDAWQQLYARSKVSEDTVPACVLIEVTACIEEAAARLMRAGFTGLLNSGCSEMIAVAVGLIGGAQLAAARQRS